jgi:hypothetical protein
LGGFIVDSSNGKKSTDIFKFNALFDQRKHVSAVCQMKIGGGVIRLETFGLPTSDAISKIWVPAGRSNRLNAFDLTVKVALGMLCGRTRGSWRSARDNGAANL